MPRILVADDDAVICRLLQVNFTLEGFEVQTAGRGEDALQKVKETPFDLILLDVMMPGMDGWEVCRRLKADSDTADIPIVFLSARAHEKDRARGLSMGVAAYVTKPFDPRDLAELARRLINGE